jgi:diguanylate cyclase (GGDEF)-like protein
MEKRRENVFSEAIELRTRTLFGVCLLVTLIGFFAYLLSRGIISPLERLTDAAGRVADGDLSVNIPVKRDDELGKATRVFNDMVSQLRQSREHLEQLSTIDSLTQLANRRHILEKLAIHLERFRRSGTPFSVLLVDADHFKRINDSAGHVVGDKVLCRLGEIFKSMLRAVDTAGRYGGEEFLIILDETRGQEALQTAERIRLAVESTGVDADEIIVRLTVSIGVAEIGAGEDEDQLVMRADAALYQAKREGRGRSVLAQLPKVKVAHHPAVRKLDHS